MNWLPTKVSDSFAKGTPPMIHGNSSTATDATRQDDSKDAGEVRDTPSENLRAGAQQMLSAAIESEVADYIEARKGIVDDAGCRLVVRIGSLPERQVTTGFGPVSVRQPRVRDKRSRDQREVFRLLRRRNFAPGFSQPLTRDRPSSTHRLHHTRGTPVTLTSVGILTSAVRGLKSRDKRKAPRSKDRWAGMYSRPKAPRSRLEPS